ncbi:MAG: ABC transporter substrate-binding protein, partial [Bacteroidota bacterium]
MRQQAVDVSFKIVPEVYNLLKDDPEVNKHYKLKRTERGTVSMIGLNNQPDGIKHPKLFNDRRVRRAIMLAVDWDDLLFNRVSIDGQRVAGPVTENNPYFDPNLPIPQYNPDSARYYLAEAGWADTDGDGLLDKEIDGAKVPFSFTLLHRSTNIMEADLATEFANDLRPYGIEVKPDNSGFSMGQLFGLQYDAVLLPLLVPSTPYPFEAIYRSTSQQSFFGYANEQADILIDKISSSTDVEKVRADAIRLQKIIIDDLPALYLFNPTRKIAA